MEIPRITPLEEVVHAVKAFQPRTGPASWVVSPEELADYLVRDRIRVPTVPGRPCEETGAPQDLGLDFCGRGVPVRRRPLWQVAQITEEPGGVAGARPSLARGRIRRQGRSRSSPLGLARTGRLSGGDSNRPFSVYEDPGVS